jgi:hypothetical protein
MTRSRKSVATGRQFAVCIDNDECEASLERNKIYVVLPDKDAQRDGDVRVVDESGEDHKNTSQVRHHDPRNGMSLFRCARCSLINVTRRWFVCTHPAPQPRRSASAAPDNETRCEELAAL